MPPTLLKILFFTVMALGGTSLATAQAEDNRLPTDKPKMDYPKSIRDMMAKRRIEQERKDHEELLKNGNEAIEISGQLERSFSQNNQLSPTDRAKLDQLASLVKKIRRGVGAADDGKDDEKRTEEEPEDPVEEKPSTLESAFKALQSTTVKLVDELKKTTRFTISAVAIQSSNTLLRIVKFIRSGK